MSSGRFASLEFEDKGKPGAPGAEAPPPGAPGARPEKKTFGLDVQDAQYHLAQAEKHELAGQHETALRSFSAALGENPLLLDAWLGQLWMLLELEEYPEAQMWADKALEKFPECAQLLAVKAVALYRMGSRQEARDLSDAAMQKKGESDLVWLCRGELTLADSRPAAEECFEHAVRASEKKGLLQLRIGAVCLRYRKYSLGLSILQNVTASLPRAARAWYLLGTLQRELGLSEQAALSLNQAAELCPEDKRYKAATKAGALGLGTRLTGIVRRCLGR